MPLWLKFRPRGRQARPDQSPRRSRRPQRRATGDASVTKKSAHGDSRVPRSPPAPGPPCPRADAVARRSDQLKPGNTGDRLVFPPQPCRRQTRLAALVTGEDAGVKPVINAADAAEAKKNIFLSMPVGPAIGLMSRAEPADAAAVAVDGVSVEHLVPGGGCELVAGGLVRAWYVYLCCLLRWV